MNAADELVISDNPRTGLVHRAMENDGAIGSLNFKDHRRAQDKARRRKRSSPDRPSDAAGDRAGALRHASVHSELLRTELDAVPHGAVVALAERLRLESRAGAVAAPTTQPTSAIPDRLVPVDTERGLPIRRGWVVPAVLITTGVVVVGLLGGALARKRPSELAPQRIAVAVFENHTGRPDLDDIGSMTADWIIRGLMETPLIDVTDLETVYADEPREAGQQADPRTLARRNRAGLVVSGKYYRSSDSVLFQGNIVDVGSGRVLRSFAPVGAPADKPAVALEALRERVASGLGALVNPANRYFPVDPDLIPPPNYSAYREFIAGLRQGKVDDWEAESRHYRRAAELDSTFMAPLVQLAYRATWRDQCDVTDSIGIALDLRRERLTAWDRFTIDLLRARCRGDMRTAVLLMGQRLDAYPRSLTAKRQYSAVLLHANHPRAAQKVLSRLDPELDPLGGYTREDVRGAYWWLMAASHHMLGDYLAELAITDRWRDSTSWAWRMIRCRALGALGQEREVLALLQTMATSSIDSVAEPSLTMATELEVHGHHATAMAVAESILVRLELGHIADSGRAMGIAWATRLLGRVDRERAALEHVARGDLDTPDRSEAQGRLAVLLHDSAEGERIDRILAEESNRPLRVPTIRGAQILARAHIAAGFGRREQAVALLQDASDRGVIPLGSSYAFHQDLLLAPLRGYAPFEALLKPDN